MCSAAYVSTVRIVFLVLVAGSIERVSCRPDGGFGFPDEKGASVVDCGLNDTTRTTLEVASNLLRAPTTQSDGGFGFPEAIHDVPAGEENSKNKNPLYVPGRCAENELLYPGDYKDDWVCDCKPGFLFHPATTKCYSPYRRGPCQPRFILTLPPGSYIPECKMNPCPQGDGFVPYNGVCHQLESSVPCRQPELSFVLGVNTTNLKLQCVSQSEALQTRFGEDEIELCPTGNRRWLEQKCTALTDGSLILTP